MINQIKNSKKTIILAFKLKKALKFIFCNKNNKEGNS